MVERPLESSSPDDACGAERASEFLIERVKAASGRLYHQGRRIPPLACNAQTPAIRFIAEHRLHRVPTAVARAIVAWGDGFPAVLLTSVPTAMSMLALQARGSRC